MYSIAQNFGGRKLWWIDLVPKTGKILVDWLLCTNNISLGEDGGTRFNSLKIHDLGNILQEVKLLWFYRKNSYRVGLDYNAFKPSNYFQKFFLNPPIILEMIPTKRYLSTTSMQTC